MATKKKKNKKQGTKLFSEHRSKPTLHSFADHATFGDNNVYTKPQERSMDMSLITGKDIAKSLAFLGRKRDLSIIGVDSSFNPQSEKTTDLEHRQNPLNGVTKDGRAEIVELNSSLTSIEDISSVDNGRCNGDNVDNTVETATSQVDQSIVCGGNLWRNRSRNDKFKNIRRSVMEKNRAYNWRTESSRRRRNYEAKQSKLTSFTDDQHKVMQSNPGPIVRPSDVFAEVADNTRQVNEDYRKTENNNGLEGNSNENQSTSTLQCEKSSKNGTKPPKGENIQAGRRNNPEKLQNKKQISKNTNELCKYEISNERQEGTNQESTGHGTVLCNSNYPLSSWEKSMRETTNADWQRCDKCPKGEMWRSTSHQNPASSLLTRFDSNQDRMSSQLVNVETAYIVGKPAGRFIDMLHGDNNAWEANTENSALIPKTFSNDNATYGNTVKMRNKDAYLNVDDSDILSRTPNTPLSSRLIKTRLDDTYLSNLKLDRSELQPCLNDNKRNSKVNTDDNLSNNYSDVVEEIKQFNIVQKEIMSENKIKVSTNIRDKTDKGRNDGIELMPLMAKREHDIVHSVQINQVAETSWTSKSKALLQANGRSSSSGEAEAKVSEVKLQIEQKVNDVEDIRTDGKSMRKRVNGKEKRSDSKQQVNLKRIAMQFHQQISRKRSVSEMRKNKWDNRSNAGAVGGFRKHMEIKDETDDAKYNKLLTKPMRKEKDPAAPKEINGIASKEVHTTVLFRDAKIDRNKQVEDVRQRIDELMDKNELQSSKKHFLALMLWAVDADLPVEFFESLQQSGLMKIIIAQLGKSNKDLLMYNMYSTE
eukprot:gene20204-22180_t